MSVVGKSIPRLDALDKVLGHAQFTDDIEVPGVWYGAVVRSTIPYGKVRNIEFDPSFDWKQVVVADIKDIPGQNFVHMIEDDVPLIVQVTKHIGEAILLIAAPTKELAIEARSRVRLTFEQWKPVLTIDESKRAEVKIRNEDNIMKRYLSEKGNLTKGFRDADEVIEGVYEVGYQEHMYIEPNAMIATARADGGFDVVGSIQCPYYISKALSSIMDVPEEKLSVRQATVGGAFGGKEDYPSILAGYCCVLSKKCGHPVKIVLERAEDTEVSTKRHPARVYHKTGVKKDGTITAMDILLEMDGGAYATMTPVVLSRGLIHGAGPYFCENIRMEGIAYATNKAHSGAFRGFGVPQAIFAVEVHMDRVAEKIGMDPEKFRAKNVLKIGEPTATGQVVDKSGAGSEVLKKALSMSSYAKLKKKYSKENTGRVRKGIGLSLFMHGGAFTGAGEARIKGHAGLRIDPSGKIVVLAACTDMGQGAHTVIPQLVADFLDLDISNVVMDLPDTAKVPNSGPTVASRTTMIIGSIMEKCSKKVKEELEKFSTELSGAELINAYCAKKGPFTVIEQYDLPPGINWDEATHKGDAYPTYSWGATVAEVEVDMETFEVDVKKVWMAEEMGKAVNPMSVEGQIEGGTLQSVGYATMEKHVVKDGKFLTNKFQTYMIPTFLDAPKTEVAILEKPYKYGPMGVKGVGEMPMNGGAPAIVNAIAHATGLKMNEIPVTPEKLFEAWRMRHVS